MCQEIEESSVIIADFVLKVFNKDSGKIILKRYITNEELGRKLYNESVNLYNKMEGRYTISLYNMNKCTNIEHYDTDDNI